MALHFGTAVECGHRGQEGNANRMRIRACPAPPEQQPSDLYKASGWRREGPPAESGLGMCGWESLFIYACPWNFIIRFRSPKLGLNINLSHLQPGCDICATRELKRRLLYLHFHFQNIKTRRCHSATRGLDSIRLSGVGSQASVSRPRTSHFQIARLASPRFRPPISRTPSRDTGNRTSRNAIKLPPTTAAH